MGYNPHKAILLIGGRGVVGALLTKGLKANGYNVLVSTSQHAPHSVIDKRQDTLYGIDFLRPGCGQSLSHFVRARGITHIINLASGKGRLSHDEVILFADNLARSFAEVKGEFPTLRILHIGSVNEKREERFSSGYTEEKLEVSRQLEQYGGADYALKVPVVFRGNANISSDLKKIGRLAVVFPTLFQRKMIEGIDGDELVACIGQLIENSNDQDRPFAVDFDTNRFSLRDLAAIEDVPIPRRGVIAPPIERLLMRVLVCVIDQIEAPNALTRRVQRLCSNIIERPEEAPSMPKPEMRATMSIIGSRISFGSGNHSRP